jgi:Tat protein secretion system quality control protein TatD with DNase activity
VGWEIFSEVDLITGATEDRAIEFAARAAAVVRAADPAHRPTTISQAGVNVWPKLLSSDAVQIVQVHPYAAHPFGGNLDELFLKSVRERLQTYRKPVLIGECGLDWAPPRGTLDVAPGAEVGIRHAIWASTVRAR